MSIIKLEIDSTDSIVCGAFAAAFQTLARGGVVKEEIDEPIVEPEAKPTLGLPHDSRIHSSGKVKNQDGTWKYARKPKDKTPDEWKDYIAQVESELEQLMSIPVPVTLEPAEPEEIEELVEEAEKVEEATPTTPAGPKPPVDKEVIEKVEEPKPKPPIAPPVNKEVAPPVNKEVAPPVEAPTSVTFAEIMKVAVKCGVANANAIVAEMGVPEPYMPNLKKREDLFPAAYAALVEATGA